MRVLLLESFYGGSHRDVADGLVAHSRHSIELLTLPDRFWKWRMRGASLWFARQIETRYDAAGPELSWDLIICTSLMDIAALKSLLGKRCPPVLLYCHETQLSYPSPGNSETDLHFAFTDLVNMMVADKIVFNSKSHRSRFLGALPQFLRRLPEFRPMWSVESITQESVVCYPGISLNVQEVSTGSDAAEKAPPLVIWNHRWEFDKSPAVFFGAIRELIRRGCQFELALLGENFNAKPQGFAEARRDFGDRIVQYGYVSSRADYSRWLSRGSVVVSTAIQENFGISVMEAIAHGCHPVLPNRLSYPEIIPARFHKDTLYDDQEGMVALLQRRLEACLEEEKPKRADSELVAYAREFAWEKRVHEFDTLLETTAEPHT